MLLVAVIAVGALLRVLLVVWSPRPEGYVYDFYHRGVLIAWRRRGLPVAADCWQCYHPPLFYLVSLPLLAVGKVIHKVFPAAGGAELRALAVLPLACGTACVYFGYRTLRLLRFDAAFVAIGTGFLLTLPVLFFSTYGVEADILLAALMCALTFYATRYTLRPTSQTAPMAAGLGLLAGLAVATKYSGLVAVPFIAGVFVDVGLVRRRYARMFRHGVVALVVVAAVGSWKYIDNVRRYGNPLFANGSALAGFDVLSSPAHASRYDLSSFQLGALFALTRPDAPEGRLTDLPVYRSFWSTMYGLTWNDLGMFSEPSRHGDRWGTYPAKYVPAGLACSVLLLGLVPTALAVGGLAVAGARRAMRPMLAVSMWTMLAYLPWALRQDEWSLKPKYLVFLALPYCTYALLGLKAAARFLPWPVVTALTLAWTVSLCCTAVYLAWFAVG